MSFSRGPGNAATRSIGVTVVALVAVLGAGAGPAERHPALVLAVDHPAEAPLRTPRGSWLWPVQPPPQVVRRFETGPAPWSPGHRGVDLAAGLAARIRAPAAGVVSFTGTVAGRPVISIDQGGGLISSMEPVIASVRRGGVVRAGDLVGTLGPAPGHCAPAACLHWGVRSNGQYVDPLLFVPGAFGPIILLPDL